MRRMTSVLLLSLALPAAAQTTPPKEPNPLAEPPLAPLIQEDQALEPQVTIIERGEEKVEEFRLNGLLYMIKVTPRIGAPYYLIDRRGDGTFTRQESLDSGLRPPMWVIQRF